MAAALRVIYVDDESDLLVLGKMFLEQSGDFSVMTALSAPDAIRLLEQERFDAIVSDYQMPGMDGIQFLIEVRKRFGPIPFILFTGRGREEVVIQAINSGADFYLQKGGEPGAQFAELAHKVRQAASRKRAEDALRKSEDKYRHLINHSNDGIVVAQDGLLKLVNRRVVEFSGYSEQELLSMSFPDLIHPDDRAMVVERYQRRLAGEKIPPSRYAFRLMSQKDGSERWIEISVTTIDWDGRPATLNFLTDITERKQAEEADRKSRDQLVRSEENLRSHKTELEAQAEELKRAKLEVEESRDKFLDLYHFAPLGYLTLSDKALITDVNLTGATLFGIERSRLIGARFSKFVAKTDSETWNRYFVNVVNQEEKQTCTFMLIRGDGSTFPARLESICIPGSNDVSSAIRVSFSDTSDIRMAENATHEAQARTTTILEGISDTFYSLDDDWRLTTINPAAEKVPFGRPAAELLGKVIWELYPDLVGTPVHQHHLDAAKNHTMEHYDIQSPMNGRWYEVFMQGRKGGVDVYMRDINDRKLAEEALRESSDRYKTLITVSNTGAWEYYRDRDYLWCSPEYFSMLGRDAREFDTSGAANLKKTWTDLLHPDDRERATGHFTQYLKDGSPGIYENYFRMQHADGHWVWIWSRGSTLRDKEGNLAIKTVGTHIDITESKQVELARTESESRLSSIIRVAPIGIGVASNRIIQTVNDRLCQMTGYSANELIGNPARFLYPSQEDYDYVGEEKYAQIAQKGSGSVETRWLKKDGTIIDVLLASTPLNPLNLSAGVTFTAMDITDRKMAEAALSTSEEFNRNLVANIPDYLLIYDQEGIILYANPVFLTQFGFAAQEAIGTPAIEHIDPRHRDTILTMMKERISNAVIPPYEISILKKDGSSVPVIVKGSHIKFEDRDAVLLLMNDISEHKRMEMALRESRDRFEAILASLDDAIILVDPLTRLIIECNDATTKIFGYSREEIIGTESSFLHVDRMHFEQFGREAIAAYEDPGYYVTVFEMRRKDGGVFPTEHVVRPIRDPDGRILYVVSLIRDITERKRAEEMLKESEQKYRDIFENSIVGIFKTTPDGRIINANNALAHMFGYFDAAEFLKAGVNVGQFYANLKDREELRHIIEEKGRVENYETQNLKLDGARFWASITARTIRDTDGNILFYEGTNIDITERKNAEEAQRESEEKYRILTERGHDGIYIYQGDHFLYTNPVITEITQYSPEELSTMHFIELVYPDDRAFVQEIAAQRWQGKSAPDRYECRIVRKDGVVRNIELAIATIHYHGGYAALGAARDITERKKMEEALQASEERYKYISETTTDFVFSCYKPEGGIYSIDWMAGAVERITGYSIDELLAMGCWRCLVHPDDTQIFDENITNLPEGTSSACTLRIRSKSGIIRYLSIHTTRVPTKDTSSSSHVFGACKDITEQKEGEEVLRESEEKYRVLFASESDGIFVVDKETGIIIDCNAAITPMYGYRKDEVIGQPNTSMSHEPDATRAAMKECQNFIPIRYHKKKDGSVFPVEITANVISFQGRDILIAAVRDITNRKKAEEAIQQANRKLALLSSITRHDITNKLAVLQGYLEILKNTQLDPSQNDFFQKVSTTAQQISEMIQFTKEYENIGVNAPVWQSSRTLIDTAIKQTPLGQVIVKNDLPVGTEVFADPLVVKVFYNLMDNAVRHGGKITTIRFSVQESGDDNLIVCEDDGDGIIAEEKEKIFIRGFGKNTGLGLALSCEILAITGITITENGVPGNGARFEITVPKGMWRITMPRLPNHKEHREP